MVEDVLWALSGGGAVGRREFDTAEIAAFQQDRYTCGQGEAMLLGNSRQLA
jgi:hypothetical protein